MPYCPEVSLSIVSHGQGALIRRLLNSIRKGVDVTYEIIITLNIPENESYLDEFKDLEPIVIRNEHLKGFGENHNASFKQAHGKFFAVLNPDIFATPLRLRPLLDVMMDRTVGACGPAVYTPEGNLEDSARRFPTFKTLVLRTLGRLRPLDYTASQVPINVDWLAGIFILFRSAAFVQINGFDTRYFMYLEDTDICRRLWKIGLRVVFQPSVSIIHDARRASRKNVQHFSWHLRSALRYLTGY